MLKVDKIDVIQAWGKFLIVAAATGLNGHVDAIFPALFADRQQELRLHQRLSAGKGHAAAGMLKVKPILIDPFEQLLHRIVLAVQLSGLGGAQVRAPSAAGALVPLVHRHPILIQPGSTRGAISHTPVAGDAVLRIQRDFRFKGNSFRVGTPEAVQAAALEKDRCTHPPSITNGALLNVKNPSGFHAQPPFSLLFASPQESHFTLLFFPYLKPPNISFFSNLQ